MSKDLIPGEPVPPKALPPNTTFNIDRKPVCINRGDIRSIAIALVGDRIVILQCDRNLHYLIISELQEGRHLFANTGPDGSIVPISNPPEERQEKTRLQPPIFHLDTHSFAVA